MTLQLSILFGSMLVFMALGMPVFLTLALAAVVYAVAFWPVMPPPVVVQTFMQGIDNIAFTAIPYFFAVGTIMNAGGMSHRLLRLARAIVGSVRGGLSHANVAANVVFAGVSGSAVADAAAVGSIMIPAMKRDGYSPAYAAAVTAAAATIGPIIPPSIPMVIFGLFTGASVSKLFLGGIVPGLLMGVFLIVTTWIIARRRNYPAGQWLGFGELWAAFRDSFFALLLPVIVVAGLVSGVATTSEIGSLACAYAIFVTLFIYREEGIATLWRAVMHAALDTARVLIIIAVSGAFIWIVASIGVGPKLAEGLKAMSLGPTTMMALIAFGLVIAGTVVEPIILLVVIVPILVPAALAAGADLIHLGVVTVLATCLGLIIPPVGILIFMTAAQAQTSALRVTMELVPFMIALCLLLALLVVYPPLVTWLPGLLDR
jgi:tripartite ATP-independent transporter DctM subunit